MINMRKIKFLSIVLVFCIMALLGSTCNANVSSPESETDLALQKIPLKISESSVGNPDEAKKKSWEGKVLVRMFISDKGIVEDAKIHKSSGSETLDNAALKYVKKVYLGAKIGNAITRIAIVPVIFKLEYNRDEIKKMQQKLNELGFDCGEPDGIISTKMEQAIRYFQQSKGLEPDGRIGSETKEALGL